ncbi:cytochrome P450 [Irpex rosettiformis]|uniref:Cytochrome P450 n=1 Tax=Irpex rosettiformis TaxID=378272 RepID=A0ACB8UE62_9APHY|nr:cytochrome P450 [Irpex rosettiformis]
MPSILLLVDIIAVGCVVYSIRRLLSKKRGDLPLPPGPKGLPFVGNLLDLPPEREWETYAQWSQTYGDIMSLQVLGQPIIILSSPKAANDLLDKRSAIYSDRPRLEMAGEIVGYANSIVLGYYDETLRAKRRMLNQCIGSTRLALKQHMPLMERSAHEFLLFTLRQPDCLRDNLRRMMSSTILSIAYGCKSQKENDRFLAHIDRIIDDFVALCAPGAFLVDVMPWLKHVPSWFPGTGWQRKAAEMHKNLINGTEEPYQWTKLQIASGNAHPSFILNGLESGGHSALNEENVKFAAMSLTAAGSDTTLSALYSFFLAMTLFPEVQKKAQAEVDMVVGNERLPTVNEDWDHLPYVRALCKELLRWIPVAPMAIPHLSTADDVYEGFFLPKGSIMFVNSWKILHNSKIYHDPEEFIPDRFLASPGYEPEPDPAAFAFGYGRRTCPGSHVAETILFLGVATSLAVFNIMPQVKNGKPVPPVARSTPGVMSHPMPFECTIKPRSAQAEGLILRANEE